MHVVMRIMRAGEVGKVELIPGKNYGFVTFKEPAGAEAALSTVPLRRTLIAYSSFHSMSVDEWRTDWRQHHPCLQGRFVQSILSMHPIMS